MMSSKNIMASLVALNIMFCGYLAEPASAQLLKRDELVRRLKSGEAVEGVSPKNAPQSGNGEQFSIRVVRNEFDPYVKYVAPEVTVSGLRQCDDTCIDFGIRYTIIGLKYKNGSKSYAVDIAIVVSKFGGKDFDYMVGTSAVSAAGFGDLEVFDPSDYSCDDCDGTWENLVLRLTPSMIQQGANTGLKVRVRGKIRRNALWGDVWGEGIITLDQRAFAALQKAMAAN